MICRNTKDFPVLVGAEKLKHFLLCICCRMLACTGVYGDPHYVHDGSDYFHLGTNKEILGKTKLKTTFDPIERILNDGGSVLIYVPKTHILNKSIYRKFAKYISMCAKIQTLPISNLFIRVDRPARPIRFFTDRERELSNRSI